MHLITFLAAKAALSLAGLTSARSCSAASASTSSTPAARTSTCSVLSFFSESAHSAGSFVCPLEERALTFTRLAAAVELASFVRSFLLHRQQFGRFVASAQHRRVVVVIRRRWPRRGSGCWSWNVVRSSRIEPKEEIAIALSLVLCAFVELAAFVAAFFANLKHPKTQ